MAFRLDLDKKATSAARKTLAKRLSKAAERFGDDDPGAALHDARKDLKKSRSLLRLMRPALTPELYRREMEILRGIARSLSAARDADVLPATLAGLREDCPGEVPEVAYVSLETRLLGRANGSDPGRTLGDRVADLEAASRRVEEWPLRDLGWDDLVGQLEWSYRRGRRAMGAARREPGDERLHEWRKRTKDLLYQLQLLDAAWPSVLDAYVTQSHRLADLLGDDHDLAVLLAVLGDNGTAPPAVEPIVRLVRRRRADLQARAWGLGIRLYAEPPKALRRRLAALISAARSHDDEVPPFQCAA